MDAVEKDTGNIFIPFLNNTGTGNEQRLECVKIANASSINIEIENSVNSIATKTFSASAISMEDATASPIKDFDNIGIEKYCLRRNTGNRSHKMDIQIQQKTFQQFSDSEDYSDIDDPEYEPPSKKYALVEESSGNESEVIPIISSSVTIGNSTEENSTQQHNVTSTNDSAHGRSSKRNDISINCTKNTNGKRVWDRKAACIYCSKTFSKLSKHLEARHADEIEVLTFMNMSKKSKERKKALIKLRNAGNYRYNKEVITSGTGSIIPSKRPAGSTDEVDTYYPCTKCLGFYKKKDLWRHSKTCIMKSEKDGCRREPKLSFSEMLLPFPDSCSVNLKTNVLSIMHTDEISLAAKNDCLILQFGSKLYQKVGHDTHTFSYISQKMRELARFLLTARSIDKSISSLKDCINVQNFPLVVTAVRKLCGYVEDENRFENASLPLKLGHSLKSCATMLKAEALMANDSTLLTEVDKFITIFTLKWPADVSNPALRTLERRKWNKLQIIPLASDIKQLHDHLSEELKKWSSELAERKDKVSFVELASATLASIILFNRRRGGEAQRLTVSSYTQRNSSPCQEEVFRSLSKFEQELAKSLTLIEVRGKRGRKVPILLKKEVKEAIDLLIQNRTAAGVSTENNFVFARCNFSSENSIRGTDVMRRYAKDCHAQYPEMITTTKLRKHVATMCQIVNLKENELDTLASFMGHDLSVHRNYYRLPESTVMLAKVSKILLAAETGEMDKYKGKSLDDVQLSESDSEDSPDESETSEIHISDANITEQCSSNQKRKSCANVNNELSSCRTGKVHIGRGPNVSNEKPESEKRNEKSNEKPESEKRNEKSKKTSRSTISKKIRGATKTENVMRKNKLSPSVKATEKNCREEHKSTDRKLRKVCSKTPWTKEEKEAVLKHLSRFIALRKVPGKKDCDICISESNGILSNRSWKQVKFVIYNEIQKLK